mmetsp:Transcript_42292/g.80824  ORF Transcript_42292/g.80824 Transcript_42292/m.80824 type:complete len:459 (-) Transcript_42292:2403-3779(-)
MLGWTSSTLCRPRPLLPGVVLMASAVVIPHACLELVAGEVLVIIGGAIIVRAKAARRRGGSARAAMSERPGQLLVPDIAAELVVQFVSILVLSVVFEVGLGDGVVAAFLLRLVQRAFEHDVRRQSHQQASHHEEVSEAVPEEERGEHAGEADAGGVDGDKGDVIEELEHERHNLSAAHLKDEQHPGLVVPAVKQTLRVPRGRHVQHPGQQAEQRGVGVQNRVLHKNTLVGAAGVVRLVLEDCLRAQIREAPAHAHADRRKHPRHLHAAVRGEVLTRHHGHGQEEHGHAHPLRLGEGVEARPAEPASRHGVVQEAREKHLELHDHSRHSRSQVQHDGVLEDVVYREQSGRRPVPPELGLVESEHGLHFARPCSLGNLASQHGEANQQLAQLRDEHQRRHLVRVVVLLVLAPLLKEGCAAKQKETAGDECEAGALRRVEAGGGGRGYPRPLKRVRFALIC